jgi:hypothetical protein
VKYNKYKGLIKIICKYHGSFKQRADVHLVGSGCKLCSDDSKRHSETYVIENFNKRHINKYNYSKVRYVSNHLDVEIICDEHGSFYQTPHNHLAGQGCPLSNGGIKHSKDIFIHRANKLHNYKYDHSLVDYKKSSIHVNIICKEHGIFKQKPNSHLCGRGCHRCGNKYSIMENKWLESFNKEIVKQVYINGYRVDGFDPKTNTIYEFYGDFWHGNPKIYNSSDLNKRNNKTFGYLYEYTINREKILKSLGYNIISIWENDHKKQLKENANRS